MSLESFYSDIRRAIGERLHALRIAHGSSQEHLAQQIGVSVQAIRNWEAGRHQPASYHVQQLANFFGITVEELIGQLPGPDQGRRGANVSIAVNGYLLSGEEDHPISDQLATINIPDSVRDDHPRVFGLVVKGDSLVGHGIHDGDIVLVDPESESTVGGIDVVMTDGLRFARIVVPALLEKPGTDESLDSAQRIGRVVWHLRKM